jgi:hypothetical protein
MLCKSLRGGWGLLRRTSCFDLHRLRIVVVRVAFEEIRAESPMVCKSLQGRKQTGLKAQLSFAEAICWRKGILLRRIVLAS